MRWSHTLSAGAALLIASLGIKVATLAGSEPAEDMDAYLTAIQQSLVQHGFAATVDRKRGFVIGLRGRCRLKVRNLQPMGTERLAIEHYGLSYGPTRYAWRGAWYDVPPHYRPLLNYYVQRELARIGWNTPRDSIVAVSAAPGCATMPPGDLTTRIHFR